MVSGERLKRSERKSKSGPIYRGSEPRKETEMRMRVNNRKNETRYVQRKRGNEKNESGIKSKEKAAS